MMMTNAPLLPLARLVDRRVLAGRASGHADRPKIAGAAERLSPTGLILIDLAGVEVLSSSYFDAALWPLWTVTPPDTFPILLNVSTDAADDIKLVLKGVGAAVWIATTNPTEASPNDPVLLGELDPSLSLTLGTVMARKETTAADLLSVDASIGATAWSNRLAALYQLRLARRRKEGRRLVYVTSWKE